MLVKLTKKNLHGGMKGPPDSASFLRFSAALDKRYCFSETEPLKLDYGMNSYYNPVGN